MCLRLRPGLVHFKLLWFKDTHVTRAPEILRVLVEGEVHERKAVNLQWVWLVTKELQVILYQNDQTVVSGVPNLMQLNPIDMLRESLVELCLVLHCQHSIQVCSTEFTRV